MDLALRLFVMSVSLIVFAAVGYMLIKRQLNESNSILWILIAVVTLIVGFFPDILTWLSNLVGISYAPTLLFLVSTLIIMLITFKGSQQLSKMDAKVNELAMTLSILKEENNRLTARLAGEDEDT